MQIDFLGILDSLWQVLLVGLLFGAGLPALFAAGIRALGTAPATAGAPAHAPSGSQRVVAWTCFGLCLAVGSVRHHRHRLRQTDLRVKNMNSSIITRALGWLRQGYADGIPAQDYVPLLEVLHRKMTDTEVNELVHLIAESEDFPVTGNDIEQAVQDRLLLTPGDADVERVAARLAAGGWPLAGFDDDGDRVSSATHDGGDA
jgi:hypothetical protein